MKIPTENKSRAKNCLELFIYFVEKFDFLIRENTRHTRIMKNRQKSH